MSFFLHPRQKYTFVSTFDRSFQLFLFRWDFIVANKIVYASYSLSLSLSSLLFLISFKFSFLEFHLTDDQVFFFFFLFFSSFSSLFLTNRVVFVLLFLYSQVIELTPYLLNSKMNSILCVDCSK